LEHPRKQLFHLIVLAFGAVVLGVLLHELGWAGIASAVTNTGSWFVVMAAVDLVSAGCDAYAIQSFLEPAHHVPYRTVYVAEISGIAINRLTPGNSLGEPIKVTTLAHSVPTNAAVAAIVMFNIVNVYVGITAIVIGVPITLLLLDLPHRIAIAVWVATGVLVVAAVAIAVIVRRGAVATLIDVIAAARLISSERARRWRSAISDIDARLRAIGAAPRRSWLWRGVAGVIGSRVLSGVGTIIVLHAANLPTTPVLVVAMLTVGILVTWVSSVIPLGLGLADGTNFALYGLLGATASGGVVFTMVNRLRTVVLALCGLAIMASWHLWQRGRSRAPDPRR
jgi:uncharacterized protein (TIRG00374 family)